MKLGAVEGSTDLRPGRLGERGMMGGRAREERQSACLVCFNDGASSARGWEVASVVGGQRVN